MNTVGKPGQLGGSIRCVVSVSMLTEGWDANTVTHVLGVRAFGTQLLCEQVIGRALRRQSYDLNEEGLFNVEYADVFGIPFDFTAKPVVAPPQPPRETIQVKAVRPERDALEIRFPRVEGYRVELPEERLTAEFNDDSVLELTPDLVGPSITRNAGIIGEGVDLNLEHLGDMRPSTLLFHLTQRLLYTKWRDPGEEPKLHLFGQLKRITKQWLDTCLVCKGDTYPGAADVPGAGRHGLRPHHRRHHARASSASGPIKALLDPYNPTGSTSHVSFNTSKTDRWETDARRCHINWVILDSDWEAEFCRVAESHPQVRAYVKNHNLGLEVPVPLRLRDAQVPARLHRAGRRRPRRRRPAAPGRRDQGLPPRGRQGEEIHDGDLLGARREQPRHATAAGPLPSSPRSTRSRPTSRPRSKASSTTMIESVAAQPASQETIAWRRRSPTKKTVETLTHDEATSGRTSPRPSTSRSCSRKQHSPDARGLRAPQPRPRPAARLARQGRAGLVRPRRPCAAALHPGEGPPQGPDRRPAAAVAGARSATAGPAQQLDLFADFNGMPEGVDKTEFYQHDQNWSNRMILGDSLQVMASLAEREGLRGKVQCIYIDPPYGIKFNSNFQWSTTSRDVKDGKADHITREPEQVKAFRDTWRDGIHSYLTYLRDRLTVARDLLTDSGSIFVQIGDENVHRVRALMDEVFGDENFVSSDHFVQDSGLRHPSYLGSIADYVALVCEGHRAT